jgi:transposase
LAHGVGRAKGGRNTKPHAFRDDKSRRCVLLLPPGNVHDSKVAPLCIAAMAPSGHLIADKGYDSQALREWLRDRGAESVIPPRKNRKIQYEYDRGSTNNATSSNAFSAASKIGGASPCGSDRNIKTFFGAVCIAAAVIWWL